MISLTDEQQAAVNQEIALLVNAAGCCMAAHARGNKDVAQAWGMTMTTICERIRDLGLDVKDITWDLD